MARTKLLPMLALLALGTSQAKAWDVGADYGVETVQLGDYQAFSGGITNSKNSPGFDLSMPVIHYTLIDYSGELAAGISNISGSLAAQAGADMDARLDAERQIRNGAVFATGHGSRTFELVQPVEGRTSIVFGTGSSTGGTWNSLTNTGAVISSKVVEFNYQRNVNAGEWTSLYGLAYAFDIALDYRSYDVTFADTTSSAKTVSRYMMGMPLTFTLAHGLGLEGLQAEAYGDFDILAGITYFAKWNGLAYGYGGRVSYKTLGFLSVFGGYDVRAFTKSSVDKNDDGSLRVEGPQSISAWRAGAAVDLSYIFDKFFTTVE